MNKIKMAHENKIPFWMGGKFWDHDLGVEYFNSKNWGGAYSGLVFVGQDLFKTWIENGERAWACIAIFS